MKKITIILTTLILSVTAIFANPSLHTIPSVRQQGFGGFYTVDVDNYYTLYSNPAGLGRRRVHALYPAIDIHFGGPLQDSAKIFQAVSSMDTNVLTQIINDNNGLNLDLNITPLLSFGHIYKSGIGWGFSTQAFVDTRIPGIALADVNAGIESVLTVGFGIPIINSDNLFLSVGATAKGFAQGSTGFTGSVVDFISKIQNDSKSMPLNIMAGFSFDAGVYLSLFNTFNFSATWYDPLSMVFVSKGTIGNPNYDFNERTKLESKLAVGFSYNFPIAWANGVVTSFTIMADYRDVFAIFKEDSRNPWLELSAGTEITLINLVSFRFGISQMYPAAGIGLRFGTFKIDFAMYGKELGFEPGSNPNLNASLFVGFTY